MIQFHTYLRAELGKLKWAGEAEKFLQTVPQDVRCGCGLPDSARDLTERLCTQTAVDGFVAALSDGNVRLLAQSCSKDWRKNDVFDKLQNSASWDEAYVPIEAIRLQQAECRLGDLFRENDYWLTRIATDERILSSEPYCNHRVGDAVSYPTCLAGRDGNAFRIFDGMHRAIQLVRNGSHLIHVCFDDAGAP